MVLFQNNAERINFNMKFLVTKRQKMLIASICHAGSNKCDKLYHKQTKISEDSLIQIKQSSGVTHGTLIVTGKAYLTEIITNIHVHTNFGPQKSCCRR